MANKLLRPQDVVAALHVHLLGEQDWTYASVAAALLLSPSQVHTSLLRADLAGLFARDERRLRPRNMLEFLVHGLRYAFFPRWVGECQGVPTAHAAPPLSDSLAGVAGGMPFVWPEPHGGVFGRGLEPLYPGVPHAVHNSPRLHAVLAMVDALRVGRARERSLAEQLLRAELQ